MEVAAAIVGPALDLLLAREDERERARVLVGTAHGLLDAVAAIDASLELVAEEDDAARRAGVAADARARCAELVAAATSELVNDPTGSTWEVVVDDHADRVALELVPRGFVDDRFTYRKELVAASSHPTIAAALVRLVAPHADDVVWDPFAGAGAELVERARLGPYHALVGTDIEGAAIAAARTNLAAAGVTGARLEVADALTYHPGNVSLIVTNPPMGRRVQRGTHGELLERFVDHAARVLAPGGALVWAAPDPTRLHARAARAKLVLERAFTVDMGGFPAELSIHRKPGSSRS